MSTIQVVGFDPSLCNWGAAVGTYNVSTGNLTIEKVHVIQPVLSKGKQVRKNSEDLERAHQLAVDVLALARDPHAIFVEVPVGSQSARAMASYGICVGVLGALRASGKAFFEVTPTEVKHITGNKNATKMDMINWAKGNHPFVEWPASAAKAEHMADAVAAIHAGLASNPFRQAIPFFKAA